MTEEIRVSICIPVYNGADTLAEALDSAFAQTEPGCEVLLVDNASTDQTRAIAERYRDRGLVIASNERNLGFNRNFNRSVELAHGRYVLILSADDVIYPDAARTLADALDAHPDAAFAFSAVDLIDPRGTPLGSQGMRVGSGRMDGQSFLQEALLRSHAVSLNCTLFHRQRLLEAGAFDVRFPNSDFMLESLLATRYAVYFHPEPLGAYRVMPDCTGEQELYGQPDLLSRKLAMLRALFERLGPDYAPLRRTAEQRWVRFTENVLVVARYRYGLAHAGRLWRDIVKNRPARVFHPRLLVAAALGMLLPAFVARGLVLLAAKLGGKEGPALRRALYGEKAA